MVLLEAAAADAWRDAVSWVGVFAPFRLATSPVGTRDFAAAVGAA